MHHLKLFARFALPFVALAAFAADDVPAPVADCTFDPHAVRSSRELWREISDIAQTVAPATATSGRHRAVTPPKSTPPQFVAKNFIDNEIFGKMKRDGIKWTSPSTDAEFLRRVTLDLTGDIPDSATVRAFLSDTSADKRDRAIDRLLNSDGFTDRWTMWYGDLVRNVQTATNVNMGNGGRNAFYKFIHDSIQSRKAYDQMVRETITGSGQQLVTGEANYTVRDLQGNGPIQDTYDNLASSTGEQFLGMPLLCTSCHGGLGHLEQVNTGMVKKTRLDFWKDAAFFAQTTATNQRDPATNVQQFVIADNTTGAYRLNTTSGNKSPRQPVNGLSVVEPGFFLTGEAPASGEPRRVAYARILTSNPQFARATVNYIWKELFGLGIVEPVDSFDLARQDPATLAPGAVLQPTHPELITQLATWFSSNGYDLRGLLKLMVSSNAYQLSSRYDGTWSETYTPYYARHYPRRLSSEALLDAMVTATQVPIAITVTNLGTVNKAMKLPDPLEGGTYRNFLNGFGRGNRDDQNRSEDTSIIQALSLMNDRIVTDRIHTTSTTSTVARTIAQTKDPGEITDALYIATLSRFPTALERGAAVNYLKSGDLSRKTEDLQYTLINRLEFLFR